MYRYVLQQPRRNLIKIDLIMTLIMKVVKRSGERKSATRKKILPRMGNHLFIHSNTNEVPGTETILGEHMKMAAYVINYHFVEIIKMTLQER